MITVIKITDKKIYNKNVVSVDTSMLESFNGKIIIKIKDKDPLIIDKEHNPGEYKKKYGFTLIIVKTIFEELNDNKICYSVCVSKTALRFGRGVGSSNYTDRDYFIVACSTEEYLKKETGKGDRFKFNFVKNENELNAIEYTLNDNEIDIFKSIQNDFVKVLHNSEGRVYELKGNSFKEYYKRVSR